MLQEVFSESPRRDLPNEVLFDTGTSPLSRYRLRISDRTTTAVRRRYLVGGVRSVRLLSGKVIEHSC